MSELPVGWITAVLSDVTPKDAPIIYGILQPGPDTAGGVPYVRPTEIDHGRILIDRLRRTTPEIAEKYKRAALKADDVLLSIVGTIGKVAITPEQLAGGNITQSSCRIRPDTRIMSAKFLAYFLKSPLATSAFNTARLGTAVPRLNLEDVRRIEVPIPPAREQIRLVAKLSAVFSNLDACRGRLDRVPEVLKKFREAVLEAAVSGRLTEEWRALNPSRVNASLDVDAIKRRHADAGGHRRGNAAPPTNDVHDLELSDFPKGWGLVDLRELVDPTRPITYGILKPGPEIAGGVLYVRVADFPNEQLNVETVRRTSPKIDKDFSRSRLRPNDLLLSIRGSVGRLIVVPTALDGANITQDSARLAIQKSVESRYVLWFLRSSVAQTRMQRAVKGVAVRGINIGDVRALQVPLPSRDEQREIFRHIDELFALADSLARRYREAVTRVGKLTPSVLAKAFRGELVPQDPNDEPAEVLLGRIQQDGSAELAAQSKVKPVRRKLRRQAFQRGQRSRASSA